jgi:Zn finger protein HypA/HybF involved in hydrogenase expression
MDEAELSKFAKRFLGPARTVSLRDRLRNREWKCSSCKLVITSEAPIRVPAPCPKCGGFAFEMVDPAPQ